jgi:hypothetical protein
MICSYGLWSGWGMSSNRRGPMKVKKYQPTLSLKPTQFAVGLLEVEYKVVEMKKLSRKKLARLVEKTPIPVVVSPWKELCIVDHHHFLFACWHANVQEVRVEVIKDYSKSKSKLSYHRFWQMMATKKYSYLYDQFGEGPRSPLYLPMDVRGMADDPYRSLAWMVRKEGAFENTTVTFGEFAWADLFRGRKLLDMHGRRGFHQAVLRGVKLARSPAARNLPGFLQQKSSEKSVKANKKKALANSKYVPKARKKGALATVPVIKD